MHCGHLREYENRTLQSYQLCIDDDLTTGFHLPKNSCPNRPECPELPKHQRLQVPGPSILTSSAHRMARW